ncbi:hypothetical protein ACROYT_G029646 [Oculina patagonica]
MVRLVLLFLFLLVLAHAIEARPRLNLGGKFKLIKKSEIPDAEAESIDLPSLNEGIDRAPDEAQFNDVIASRAIACRFNPIGKFCPGGRR